MTFFDPLQGKSAARKIDEAGVEVGQLRRGSDGNYVVSSIDRLSGYISLEKRAPQQSNRMQKRVHVDTISQYPLIERRDDE